ncbi:hypothetical protein F8M41_006082 [Gigaspora margarita]|uniref:Uncharacterized protein n=1 Tax=Gigaspora margarita TaxID=4874 RepID=A0A8H3X6Z3_GIGMA|nr:hypothetical protein F8M41_006082 [Gigaspora margarita]
MIQDQWPAIVEIHFTSLGKALDPYSLEVYGSEVGIVSPNEHTEKKSHAQDLARIPKIYQSRWNSWYCCDYNYVIESTVYTLFAISDIYKSDTNNNSNSFSKQKHNSILNDGENSLTIRAIIIAAQYSSGYYEVQEFFYKPGSRIYFDTLITTKATIQTLLPGIVKDSFTTSDKVLDPYALETCEYKLIYSENFESQIERRCKRAFEDDFYMVFKS